MLTRAFDHIRIKLFAEQAAAVVFDEFQLLGRDIDRIGFNLVFPFAHRRAIDWRNELQRHGAKLTMKAKSSSAS